MALTATKKQQLLDDLEEAYYQGALEVKYQDKTIRYASGAEMRARINELKTELGLISQSGRLLAKTSKGLC